MIVLAPSLPWCVYCEIYKTSLITLTLSVLSDQAKRGATLVEFVLVTMCTMVQLV